MGVTTDRCPNLTEKKCQTVETYVMKNCHDEVAVSYKATGEQHLTHMQTLKKVTQSADYLCRYLFMLGALHSDVFRRFEDLRMIKGKMHVIFCLFSCNVNNAAGMFSWNSLTFTLKQYWKSTLSHEYCWNFIFSQK